MAVIKLPQSSIQGSGFSEGISLMGKNIFNGFIMNSTPLTNHQELDGPSTRFISPSMLL